MFKEFKIKSILKKELTKEKYKTLPDEIKKDKRVVKHFIKSNPENIGFLENDIYIVEYVLLDYSLIKHLNKKQLNYIFSFSCISSLDFDKISIDKSIFDCLTHDNQLELFKASPKICINYFNNDEKTSLIYKILYSNLNNKTRLEFFNLLSNEEIENIIYDLLGENILFLLKEDDKVKKYVCNILAKLPFDKIKVLYEECNELLRFFPQEYRDRINIKNAQGNIGKILNLDASAKAKMALSNPRLLMFLNSNEIDRYIELSGTITCDIAYYFRINSRRTDILYMSEEEKFKFVLSDYSNMYDYFIYGKSGYSEYSKVNKLVLSRIDKILNGDKAKKAKKLYMSLSTEPFFKNNEFIYKNELFQISKLLFDERIVNCNDIELIEKYKQTKDRDILVKIISNAYGSHVEKIFKKRPNLNIDNIESFAIFDNKIYDVLGIEFINFALTYSLYKCNSLVYEFSKDEKLLISFKNYFNIISENYDNININFIYNALDKFIVYKDILKNIDYENISDKKKKNINLLINDSLITSVYIDSIDDLENYEDIRTKAYSDYIDSLDNSENIKNMIFSYVTNRELPSYDSDCSLDKLSLFAFFKVFNISYILSNQDLIKNIGLTKDNISLLLLLNKILLEIRDKEILRDTFKAIVVNNLDYGIARETVEKIQKYCIESMKKDILSKEKLDKLDVVEKDGIEIIKFDSQPFSALISVTGLNISSGRKFIKPPFGKYLLNSWLYMENGYSHISTAFVSSDTSIYPLDPELYERLKGNVAFIFDNDVDIQAMGTSDISSSHNPKSLHFYNYLTTNNNEIGFLPIKEFKDYLKNKKVEGLLKLKFASEVLISRFKEDIRKSDSGKRVMPIGIYVIGEITEEVLETAKVFNEYYKKNNLGKFRIVQVNPQVYLGRGYINSKGKGEKSNEHIR